MDDVCVAGFGVDEIDAIFDGSGVGNRAAGGAGKHTGAGIDVNVVVAVHIDQVAGAQAGRAVCTDVNRAAVGADIDGSHRVEKADRVGEGSRCRRQRHDQNDQRREPLHAPTLEQTALPDHGSFC